MATVLNFPASNADLRKARHDNDLSLVQAAIALDVVPSTLDSWERGKGSGVCPDKAFLAYKEYCQNTANMRRAGKNVLFGCFPLRVARDLLDMSIAEISDEFGYKASF